jgi:hypothetical protein
MEYLAYYFNKARESGKEEVVTFKQDDLPRDVALDDYEKGRADKLTDFVWLTDDTISHTPFQQLALQTFSLSFQFLRITSYNSQSFA